MSRNSIKQRLNERGEKALKIKEFAESKNVSNQAIYKALNRAGYSTKQITNKYGNISPQGMRILKKLFPDDLQQDPEPGAGDQQPEETARKDSREAEYLREKIKELEKQCEEWKTKCNEWEERYFDLQQSKAREAQELRGLLLQEQQLRMSVEKRGFFKRLFSGKQDNE